MGTPRRSLLSALLVAAACTATPAETPEPAEPAVPPEPSTAYFEDLLCAIPGDVLLRVWRGYHPERSGEVQLITTEKTSVATWYSHSGPWPYLQEVPLLFYGPGQVPETGPVDSPATLADLAPTIAEHIGFGYRAPDGRVLPETIDPARAEPPRLVVVMVWDSAGRNVLAEHPGAYPTLEGLIDEGVWFDRTTVGSSPTISASVHATIGTGAFPRHHGRVDHHFRFEDEIAFVEFTGTRDLILPTMAEVYDRAQGNRAQVGLVAFDNWHLGMIGHGSYLEGADSDLVALRRPAGWGLSSESAPLFSLPAYANDVPEPDVSEVDLLDGKADGLAFGQALLDDEEMIEKLSWSEWETRLIREIVRREGFGADDLPDLLFTNYKQIDEVGHEYTMHSDAMKVALRATDLATAKLIRMLDRQVGAGRWVLVVTADHGSTPDPKESGGFFVAERALAEDIEALFDLDDDDRPVVERLRPTELFVDIEELEEHGFTVGQLARFVYDYTKGQNVDQRIDLPDEERAEKVFAAVVPGPTLETAPCVPQQ